MRAVAHSDERADGLVGREDTSATEGVGMASGVASEHSGWRCMRVTGVVMILKEQ